MLNWSITFGYNVRYNASYFLKIYVGYANTEKTFRILQRRYSIRSRFLKKKKIAAQFSEREKPAIEILTPRGNGILRPASIDGRISVWFLEAKNVSSDDFRYLSRIVRDTFYPVISQKYLRNKDIIQISRAFAQRYPYTILKRRVRLNIKAKKRTIKENEPTTSVDYFKRGDPIEILEDMVSRGEWIKSVELYIKDLHTTVFISSKGRISFYDSELKKLTHIAKQEFLSSLVQSIRAQTATISRAVSEKLSILANRKKIDMYLQDGYDTKFEELEKAIWLLRRGNYFTLERSGEYFGAISWLDKISQTPFIISRFDIDTINLHIVSTQREILLPPVVTLVDTLSQKLQAKVAGVE